MQTDSMQQALLYALLSMIRMEEERQAGSLTRTAYDEILRTARTVARHCQERQADDAD